MIDHDCTDQVKWATKPGPPGKDGKDGATGPPGPRGPEGPPASDERIAQIVVAVVNEMRDELRGQDGQPGRPGKDAPSLDVIVQAVLDQIGPIQIDRVYVDEQGNQGLVTSGQFRLGVDKTITLYDGPGSEKQHREMLDRITN